MKRIGVLLILIVLGAAGPLGAQAGGALTGSIEGRVSLGGTTVPGVLVTIESPTLQGKRSVVTGPNGDFIFRQLPPGAYTIHYALSGAKPQQHAFVLSLGDTSRQDANLDVASTATEVVVSGSSIAADEEKAAVHGATFRAADVSTLPVARTLAAIAANTPGLTSRSTPNVGQLSISGGFAFDNKFLVNGVDIGDNLFGSATNQLVIEEAVQETQVLTSGISAEYGGFSGGVINTITKSGGNQFSGTSASTSTSPTGATRRRSRSRTAPPRRATSTRPTRRRWAARSCATGSGSSSPAASSSATRPAPRCRVRRARVTTTDESALPDQADRHDHVEPQPAGRPTSTTNRKDKNRRQLRVIDVDPPDPERPVPQRRHVAQLLGRLHQQPVGELRYSEKKFQFKGLGGSSTDIDDSPFLPRVWVSATTSCTTRRTSTPPTRRTATTGISPGQPVLLPVDRKAGSHDMKFGVERFTTTAPAATPRAHQLRLRHRLHDGRRRQPASSTPTERSSRCSAPASACWELHPDPRRQADITTDAFFVNDRWSLRPLVVQPRRPLREGAGHRARRHRTRNTDAIVPRLGAS